MKRLLSLALCALLIFSLCSCGYISDFLAAGAGGTEHSSESESYNNEEAEQSASEQGTQSELSSESDEATELQASSEYIPPVHEHEFTSVVVEPGCLERGYTEHECECGYNFIDTFVDSIGYHSFERGACTVCEEIDYPELINLISTETIKANVSVKTQFSNKPFFQAEQIVGISNGSGVIIKQVEASTYIEYYVLTNNHVVYCKDLEDSTQYTTYYIIDYIGTEYQADCIANLPEYDLALMKFTSTEAYTVLSLEEGNSVEGDLVVSLGQPEGQSNTITLGNVSGYNKVSLKSSDPTESNVTFDVLQHDAYINNGSSGGALLDSKLNVIGINYAGAVTSEGESVASYAIPVEQVYNFFDEIGFAYKDEAVEEQTPEDEAQTSDEAETEEVA